MYKIADFAKSVKGLNGICLFKSFHAAEECGILCERISRGIGND